MSTPPGNRRQFRLRPRYRLFAYGTLALGVISLAAPFLVDVSRAGATIGGVVALALAALYLLSPAWQLVVVIDDGGLEVVGKQTRRFRLEWNEVTRVVASPGTRTCFVDGGAPARSLMVPGRGAPAPYLIEDRDALYAAILSRVRPDIVHEVDFLKAIGKEPAPTADGTDPDSDRGSNA